LHFGGKRRQFHPQRLLALALVLERPGIFPRRIDKRPAQSAAGLGPFKGGGCLIEVAADRRIRRRARGGNEFKVLTGGGVVMAGVKPQQILKPLGQAIHVSQRPVGQQPAEYRGGPGLKDAERKRRSRLLLQPQGLVERALEITEGRQNIDEVDGILLLEPGDAWCDQRPAKTPRSE